MDKTFYVVYACDNNYALQTGVSLYSLLENNQDMSLCVYIFSNNISQDNIEKLQHVAEKFSQKLIIKELPDLSDLAGVKLDIGSWAAVNYCRLFFPELLPNEIDKVLYLDSDTIVNDSLKDLFDEDISGYAAAGVLDGNKRFKTLNGFKQNESYYNAGLLYLNLDYWRNRGVYENMLKEIRRRKGKSIDSEQSYNNCVLKGQIKTISPKYNYQIIYTVAVDDYEIFLRESGYRSYEIYNKSEIVSSSENVKIYHITSSPYFIRPWFSNSVEYPFGELWRHYLNKTEWRDCEFLTYTKKDSTFKVFLKKIRLFSFCKSVKNFIYKIIVSIPLCRIIYVRIKYGFWQKNIK